MKLTSLAFKEGSIIPSRFTCEGADVNPPLEFSGIPEGTKSLALIMDDPDVPHHIREDRIWIHWVVFNIPPTTHKIAEHSQPPGAKGKNTSGRNKYEGPCPPDREHRYFFKLYALDTMLNLPEGATKEELENTMKGHILAHTELMGRYEKGKGY